VQRTKNRKFNKKTQEAREVNLNENEVFKRIDNERTKRRIENWERIAQKSRSKGANKTASQGR
jgi:ectoine hydroxylase-related dioxygenase (phytanoyl-CoA dioxygenase family)